MEEYYFDGDPATDSTRRRLERILKEPQRPRWPWIAALTAGGAAFIIWRIRRRGHDKSAEHPGSRS